MNTFEQYRPLLFSIAYRMLGSAMEAEDMVQETYLRYQAVPPEDVQSPKSYLCTIVTRLCLNHLQSARVQRETYLGPWLPEPVVNVDDPQVFSPARRAAEYDSISLAFLVLLENLNPAERAVFLLREVFDYGYDEIADIVDKSEAACRQLFSRAKKYLAQNRPRFHSTPSQHQQLLGEFVTAVTQGNLDGLMNLLTEDATFYGDGGGKARGASIHPVQGRQAVAQFVLGSTRFTPTDFVFELVPVNGEMGLVIRAADGRATTVVTIEGGNGRIHTIRAIANPDKLQHI